MAETHFLGLRLSVGAEASSRILEPSLARSSFIYSHRNNSHWAWAGPLRRHCPLMQPPRPALLPSENWRAQLPNAALTGNSSGPCMEVGVSPKTQSGCQGATPQAGYARLLAKNHKASVLLHFKGPAANRALRRAAVSAVVSLSTSGHSGRAERAVSLTSTPASLRCPCD